MDTTSVNKLTDCPQCGFLHLGQCPPVKAIEYYPDGTIMRVVYRIENPSDYLIMPATIVPYSPSLASSTLRRAE